MPAAEKLRFRLPEEPAEAIKIRGLPVSHAITIRSSLPSPTTVEFATGAYEWLANPTVKGAVCTSLGDFMLQPSPSTLFSSSFNPPISSYFANQPSNLLLPSSSESRRNAKRRIRNPYPSFASSSHSLASSSTDDFFDFNKYSSSSLHTAPAGVADTEIEMAPAGPSQLAAIPLSPMGLSPLPMAVSPPPMGLDPSSDLYPSSPMIWSPPPGDSMHLGLSSDFPDYTLSNAASDLSSGPSTSTALPMPSREERPYELQGIQSSGNFMPVIVATPTTVALDDNASVLSTNTTASSSVGAAGDLNAILKLVFSDTGTIFEGAEFLSTKYIKRKMPVLSALGKSSRLVMQGVSFEGSQWMHVGISLPNAISPMSQLTLDIFCKLQLMHAQTHGDTRPIEFYNFESAKSILFATHMAAHQYRISMQSSYKTSFASRVIDGWHLFRPADGEKLTFRKVITASKSISKELAVMAKGNLQSNDYDSPIISMAITWMTSFFYEQDKSIAKRLKKFVKRYPGFFAPWSPAPASDEEDVDDNNDEKGEDENGRQFCPFLHYFPPSCCSFALTLLKSTLMEMLGVIELDGYDLDKEVTLLDLHNILHRPRNLDFENGLFIRFFDKIGGSLRGNELGMTILKKRLNSLAKLMLKD